MPPAPIYLLFFAISAVQHLYGELQRQETLLFCHRRSLEQVDGEATYTKSGQIGNLLIDISRWLNELKRGWFFRAHYIPGHVTVHLLIRQRKESLPLAEGVKKSAKKHLFRSNKRHI